MTSGLIQQGFSYVLMLRSYDIQEKGNVEQSKWRVKFAHLVELKYQENCLTHQVNKTGQLSPSLADRYNLNLSLLNWLLQIYHDIWDEDSLALCIDWKRKGPAGNNLRAT